MVLCDCVAACSDAGTSEQHKEDGCGSISSSRLNDAPQSLTSYYYMCEQEIAPSVCPLGWVYYRDDGSEGVDSCLKVTAGTFTSWAAASTGCYAQSHLLTVQSNLPSSGGLMRFAMSLYQWNGVYVGCWQSSSATQRAGGWNWVDNTPTGNLNCGGGGGGNGCGAWNAGQPECAALPLLASCCSYDTCCCRIYC